MGLARTLALSAACAASVVLAAAAGAGESGDVSLDADLWTYERPPQRVSGTLDSRGSDTMSELMTLWAEGFARYHPDARVRVEGKGSATAPAALIEGAAQLGPMHRVMTGDEAAAFESARRYAPTPVRVCMDAVAAFVHRDNPIESLSLERLDGIFSRTRRRGGAVVDTWEQVGVGGGYSGKAMSIHGLDRAVSTHGFFASTVLGRGACRDAVERHPGSRDVVEAVSEDRFAIGYGRLADSETGVRAVPLSAAAGAPAVAATHENVAAGAYPLGRSFRVYVDKAPRAALPPLLREFLGFVLSRAGQAAVVEAGYLPLDERACAIERAKLE